MIQNSFTRNKSADIAKGLLAYLVILGHCLLLTAGSLRVLDNGNNQRLVFIIYSFHMPLFMLISGYYSRFSLRKNGYKNFIKNRTIQLILPLVSWAVIQCSIGYFQGEIKARNIVDGFAYRVLNGYWFNRALFILSVMLAVYLVKNKILTFAFSIAFLMVCFFIPDSVNSIDISGIKFMYPYFMLGYKWGGTWEQHNIKLSLFWQKYNKQIIALLNIILILNCALYREKYLIHVSGYTFLGKDIMDQLIIDTVRFVIGLINSAAIYLDIFMLNSRKKSSNSLLDKIFIWSGKNSLGLYLINTYFINYLICPLFIRMGKYNAFLAAFSSFAVWLCCYIFIKIVQKSHLSKILL